MVGGKAEIDIASPTVGNHEPGSKKVGPQHTARAQPNATDHEAMAPAIGIHNTRANVWLLPSEKMEAGAKMVPEALDGGTDDGQLWKWICHITWNLKG